MDIVEKFCGIPVPDWGEFCDFIHLKRKIFAVRVDQRWLRAPDKGIFLGRLDVGNRGTKSGIPVSSQSEQEVILLELTQNLQQQERQTAADSYRLC